MRTTRGKRCFKKSLSIGTLVSGEADLQGFTFNLQRHARQGTGCRTDQNLTGAVKVTAMARTDQSVTSDAHSTAEMRANQTKRKKIASRTDYRHPLLVKDQRPLRGDILEDDLQRRLLDQGGAGEIFPQSDTPDHSEEELEGGSTRLMNFCHF